MNAKEYMVLPLPEDCDSAELLGQHVAINFVLFVHLLLSLIAIALILYFGFVSPQLRRFFSLIHKNLKVVLYFGILTYFAHSIFIIVLRAQSLISALRPFSKCDYRWDSLNCLMLKVPIYFCVMAFSVLHLGLFLERTIATYCFRSYSKFSYKVGTLVLLLMLFVTTCTVYFVYRNEELNIPRAYCLSTTSKSAPQLQWLMVIACLVDVLSTIGDFVMYHTNKKLKEVTRSGEYTLDKKFQIRENQLSLNLLIPLSIIHSIFFISYLVASIILRSIIVNFDSVHHILIIELLQSAVCTYIIVMILSIVFLWQRIDTQKPDWLTIHPARNNADIYFEQLRQQMQNAHSMNVQQSDPIEPFILRVFRCCKFRETDHDI